MTFHMAEEIVRVFICHAGCRIASCISGAALFLHQQSAHLESSAHQLLRFDFSTFLNVVLPVKVIGDVGTAIGSC